jgi:hypothetical protein
MLCSKCGDPVRPVVAVDIDGTLGNYHGHFWDFARGWLGVPVPDPTDTYRGEQPYRQWFMQAYDVDRTTWNTIKLAYRQGGQKRTMPLYPGAHVFTDKVRRRAELWLTTTRPHARYDRIDPDTVEWLDRNHIWYDALLFDEDKVRQLANAVDRERVVAVLDDELTVLEDVRDAGLGVPILRRTLYNQAVHWTGWQATDLSGAWVEVERLLDKWVKKYE